MKKTPSHGQKTIFWWFEKCGISLDMFERVKWPVLWNLSLISIIMKIHEKKIGTLSTEIGPTATKIVKFFSPILVIYGKRLKFWSTGHLTLSNMSKLILHCSNHKEIIFWPWSGVKWGKINMCHKIKKFSNGLMNHFPRYWVKIPKFDNYHPPYLECNNMGQWWGVH